jgi:ABC-2 type transport system ATP-binding protein
VLELRGIRKSFGARRAVDDVSFTVEAGQAVLLVGRNGAGKTTLLRIATGFLDANSGSVIIDGVDLALDRAGAQKKLGYLPEHAPAPSDLTVRAHLLTRARLKGVGGRRAAREAVERVMNAAAVTSEAERRIGVLSKGYRQRVGLADALLGDPALLVLDEPTSGMDPIQTKELRGLLVEIAKERAVIVSSHAVADFEGLAAKIAVMRGGKLVAFDAPETLIEAQGVAKLDEAVIALLGDDAKAAS